MNDRDLLTELAKRLQRPGDPDMIDGELMLRRIADLERLERAWKRNHDAVCELLGVKDNEHILEGARRFKADLERELQRSESRYRIMRRAATRKLTLEAERAEAAEERARKAEAGLAAVAKVYRHWASDDDRVDTYDSMCDVGRAIPDGFLERAAHPPAPAANLPLDAGTDTPWPVRDVLATLTDAAEHLLRGHDCDAHGWEGVSHAITAARAYLAPAADDSKDLGAGSAGCVPGGLHSAPGALETAEPAPETATPAATGSLLEPASPVPLPAAPRDWTEDDKLKIREGAAIMRALKEPPTRKR